jgi:hypothetical protein
LTLHELEHNISKYLILEDNGIIKLLAGTVIANRIKIQDPVWLFVATSSSGAKSELLLALSYASGVTPKDDLTSKTFISGAKRTDHSANLLDRLGEDAILVVKDLTVLLKKDERESAAIFSQLRMIYDGTFSKSFGTGEDVEKKDIRMGLIAGVTSVIEDYQADDAAVGQRAIKYYMKQSPDEGIDEITFEILGGRDDKGMRKMIGESFKEYLDGTKWDLTKLPELNTETKWDLSKLSNMATKARSSIKRKAYSSLSPIERKNLREMPYRFAKQLANLARAFMIMNNGSLLPIDNAILFKIALDSIPSSRKEVMEGATANSLGITLQGLAEKMRIPEESAKIHLDDLVALEIIDRHHGQYDKKFVYKMREDYRQIMSKFENIVMEDKVLDKEEEFVPLPEEPDIGVSLEDTAQLATLFKE